MATWAGRRKLIYFFGVCAVIFIVLIIPTFFIVYQKPTCFDGKKNGDEFGPDCGGSCQLLCSFEAIEPSVLWSRSFKVVNGIYSAVAYIENHNINSEALNVPYVFSLYDNKNTLLATREGVAYIPKNKIFAIFEPNISVGDQVPTRTTFSFKSEPKWVKDLSQVPGLVVEKKHILREGPTPRVDATIKNISLETFSNIEVTAIVRDGKGNAIGVSRTFIDSLEKDKVADVVFTWPMPFETQETVCKIPADVMVVMDRSGSMAGDGKNPPQPLTDVKNAAILFVNQLSDTDRVGVVSYADEASEPIDLSLTSNFDNVKRAIEGINIASGTVQNTNIAGGLEAAIDELNDKKREGDARRVVVLLTDGVANRPEKEGDELYPESAAAAVAAAAQSADIRIYTIGLGNEVHQDFLQSISTGPGYFFQTVSSEDLGVTYKDIATSICKDSPTSLEIIPIVLKSAR